MKRRFAVLGVAALACISTFASAQVPYPNRPVKLIVPFAAGG